VRESERLPRLRLHYLSAKQMLRHSRNAYAEGTSTCDGCSLSASISGMPGSISGNISETLSKAVEEDLRSKGAAGSSSRY
jgi:hypothetical protein